MASNPGTRFAVVQLRRGCVWRLIPFTAKLLTHHRRRLRGNTYW